MLGLRGGRMADVNTCRVFLFFTFFFFMKHRAVPVNASPCPDMACAGTCAAISKSPWAA